MKGDEDVDVIFHRPFSSLTIFPEKTATGSLVLSDLYLLQSLQKRALMLLKMDCLIRIFAKSLL